MTGTAPIEIPRQAGIHVRREREAQSLTRAQLAQSSGVSERLLASLELGDATGIRLDKLLAVLHALGLTLAVQSKAAEPEGLAPAGALAASGITCVDDTPASSQPTATSLAQVDSPVLPSDNERTRSSDDGQTQGDARPRCAEEPAVHVVPAPLHLSPGPLSSRHSELYRQLVREQGGSPETTIPGIPIESGSLNASPAAFAPGVPVIGTAVPASATSAEDGAQSMQERW